MWFEMWSNNTPTFFLIYVLLVHRPFPIVSFLTNGHFLQGFPATNSVPARISKVFTVMVDFVS